ncbi:hypothetical protein [Actinomadura monticuli]|uniref:CD225/dispanin family protein n=1 Tax=Actinomadura monticuli TaxID=3097367 RepID=A0ABV4Q6Y0_9ACTN
MFLGTAVPPSEQSGSGWTLIFWGLTALAITVPIVINYRGYADWVAGRRWNRALHKTHRQSVLYQRLAATVFTVIGFGAFVLGVIEVARG